MTQIERSKPSFPFGIKFVFETDLPDAPAYRNSDPEEIQTDCPFCNGKGKMYLNTVKNTYYCQHCKEHGGMLNFHARNAGLNSNKASMADLAARFNNLSDEERQKVIKITEQSAVSVENSTAGDIEERNRCYSNLIKYSALSYDDHMDLLRRGLTDEAIKAYGIVSTPVCCKTIAEKMVNDGKPVDNRNFYIHFYNKQGSEIPGIFPYKGTIRLVKLKPGILIKVVDRNGKISMFQVRYHNLKPLRKDATDKEKAMYQRRKETYHKYAQLSSGYKEGGCSTSGLAKVHHVGFDFTSKATPHEVCVTEGCLKADVASFLEGGKPYLAILGVNNTNQLNDEFDWLISGGTTSVRIRFDMDFLTNDAVRQAIYEANAMLQAKGMTSVVVKPRKMSAEYKSLYDAYRELMAGKIGKRENPPLNFTVVSSKEEMMQAKKNGLVAITDLWKPSEGKGIDDYDLQRGGKE